RLSVLARAQQSSFAGKGNLAVGTGTDAQVIPEAPVVQIVARAMTLSGKGRDLVALEAAVPQQGQSGLLDVDQLIFRGQRRRAFIEFGIGFYRQLIPRQMLRRVR